LTFIDDVVLYHPPIIAAIAGLDFTSISSDKTFPSGSISNTTLCVNISILEDTLLEDNETFTLTLTASDPHVLLANNVTSITIVDAGKVVVISVSATEYIVINGQYDDGPIDVSVGFSSNEFTTSEADGSVEVCVSVTGGRIGTEVVIISLTTLNGQVQTLCIADKVLSIITMQVLHWLGKISHLLKSTLP